MSKKPLIIAIDGPAASGKGTLARKIAAHYGLPHLDTGLTYRGVAEIMLCRGVSLEDEGQAVSIASKLDLSQLDISNLGRHEIGEAASKIAVFPRMRQTLVAMQRNFALSQPLGAVLDGRDIGTVVVPEAAAKLYVTASAEVRARRRYEEIVAKGKAADIATILADITRRDERDRHRREGALKQAQDAYLLDTSKLTIESAFLVACRFIDMRATSEDCAAFFG